GPRLAAHQGQFHRGRNLRNPVEHHRQTSAATAGGLSLAVRHPRARPEGRALWRSRRWGRPQVAGQSHHTCDGQSDPRVKPEDDEEREGAMPLILTEEQTMLKDAADGFLSEHAPIAHFRKLRDSRDADGVSRDLWKAFGEMGFAGVIIPEEHGGSGL